MKPADHITTSRILYMHHGIYLGDEGVIHYSDSKGIEIVSLDEFRQGSGVSVCNSLTAAFDNDEIIVRAKSRLNEDNYCLVSNNCEHFVNWCIAGKKSSHQVQTVAAVTATTVCSYALRAGLRKQAAQQATRIAGSYLTGGSTAVGSGVISSSALTTASSSALVGCSSFIAATPILPYVAIASAGLGVIYLTSVSLESEVIEDAVDTTVGFIEDAYDETVEVLQDVLSGVGDVIGSLFDW